MSIEPAPAFQFYVKEWRSSRAIMRMTFAQRGMYLEMLLEQWESGSLPDCPEAVAHLIGGKVEEWQEAWPVLRRKFVDRRYQKRETELPIEHDANRRILNLKLEQVRKSRRLFKKTARMGGLARSKSAKRRKNGTYSPAVNPAVAPAGDQPPTSSSSPSPSPSPSANKESAPAPESADATARMFELYRDLWKATYGLECSLHLSPLQFVRLDEVVQQVGEAEFRECQKGFFASSDAFVVNARHPLGLFLKEPTKYLATTVKARPRGCRHEPACADDVSHTARASRELREQAS